MKASWSFRVLLGFLLLIVGCQKDEPREPEIDHLNSRYLTRIEVNSELTDRPDAHTRMELDKVIQLRLERDSLRLDGYILPIESPAQTHVETRVQRNDREYWVRLHFSTDRTQYQMEVELLGEPNATKFRAVYAGEFTSTGETTFPHPRSSELEGQYKIREQYRHTSVGDDYDITSDEAVTWDSVGVAVGDHLLFLGDLVHSYRHVWESSDSFNYRESHFSWTEEQFQYEWLSASRMGFPDTIHSQFAGVRR